MRCESCNKFVSYSMDNDPEVNDLEINSEDGSITGSVRIALGCEQCGTELKEATFDIETKCNPGFLDKHKGNGHELSVDDTEFTITERQDNIDKTARSRKTFYGYSGVLSISCICTDHMDAVDRRADNMNDAVEVSDDTQASNMDEC